jgi:hypothetical protein
VGGGNEYILIFPGEKLVYAHFSGGEMSRGKNEYVTPVLHTHFSPILIFLPGKMSIYSVFPPEK